MGCMMAFFEAHLGPKSSLKLISGPFGTTKESEGSKNKFFMSSLQMEPRPLRGKSKIQIQTQTKI